MKKILLATTVLAFSGGVAAAEIALSGTAAMGLKYNSETAESAWIFNKVVLTADMTGETDSGLAFGANMNLIVENNGDVGNDDTTVFMSGAFGKLSMGAVGEADEVAGLSDIGWDGLDVDDVAETLVGDEIGDFAGASISHNVNYTYAVDAFSVSISGQLAESGDADDVDSYAIGGKYNFGDAYVGLGYADHSINGDDAEVVSLFGGGTFGAFKVAALYSDASFTSGGVSADAKSYGLNVAYTMDALTLSAGYGSAEFDGVADDAVAYGIGAAYDLGGGAVLSGGIAQIENSDENVTAFDETRADFGVTFSF